MNIIHKKDAKAKGLMHYYTGKPCKYGHYSVRLVSTGKCSVCAKQYHDQYIVKWQMENKEKVNAATRKWRSENKEQATLTHKNYYNTNKEQKLEYNKQWRKENNDKVMFYNAERRATILNATVKWADYDKIKQLYEHAKNLTDNTGEQYHVDHIIPLTSDVVCGLHCEDNLQVITATENFSKGNRFT